MGFLRKLFGGGSLSGSVDRDGLYFYIRSTRTGEVIQVRLHRFNDLSASDDYTTYYARKMIVGQTSFDRIEAEFTFDKNRRMISAEINGGELVDRAAYDAFLAAHPASNNAD